MRMKRTFIFVIIGVAVVALAAFALTRRTLLQRNGDVNEIAWVLGLQMTTHSFNARS